MLTTSKRECGRGLPPAQKFRRHPAQFTLLGAVHGSFGGLHGMAAAGLHLDEAQHIPSQPIRSISPLRRAQRQLRATIV